MENVQNKNSIHLLKFGSYYDGYEWTWDLQCGVGLEFTGVPTDEAQFIEVLMEASCNPVASRRILDTLKEEGIKQVTVMSGLAFDNIGDALAKLGVAMKIIAPYIYPGPEDIENNAQLDYLALKAVKGQEIEKELEKISIFDKQKVLDRVEQTRRSLKQVPTGFGKY